MYKNKEKKRRNDLFVRIVDMSRRNGRASARPAGSGIRLRKNRQHQRPRAEAAEEVPEKSGNQLP